MNWILIFIISFGCSHAPERAPASEKEELIYGKLNFSNSTIKLFEDEQLGEDEYAFYIEARDKNGSQIDLSDNEINIFHSGRIIPFSLQRLSQGNYLLSLEIFSMNGLKIYIQGKEFRHHFKRLAQPSRRHSNISIIEKKNHELWLKLTLLDKDQRPIIAPFTPDITIEGFGQVEELKEIGKGEWTFKLIFPEHSQILYLSVRSNGSYLPRIFRFHYVDN